MKTKTGSAQRFDSLGHCPFWFFRACEASRRPVWAIQGRGGVGITDESASAVLGQCDRDVDGSVPWGQILRCNSQRKPCHGRGPFCSSADYGPVVQLLLPPLRQAVALCGQFRGRVASVPQTSSFSTCWSGVTRMWAAVPFWPWFALRETKKRKNQKRKSLINRVEFTVLGRWNESAVRAGFGAI